MTQIVKPPRTAVSQGLVGWWTFERAAFTSGDFLNYPDSSGYNNSATKTGVAAQSLVRGRSRAYNGPLPLALSNGSSGGATCGTHAEHYSPAAYTYTSWIVVTSTASAGPKVFMSQATSGSTNPLRGHHYINTSTGKMSCETYLANVNKGYTGGSHTFLMAQTTPVWYHCAMVCSAAGVIGYVNGAVDGTSAAFAGPATSSCELYLASTKYSTAFPFPGYVDDCRIYNRALSQGEIVTIMSEAFQPSFDLGMMIGGGTASVGGKFRRTLSHLGTRTGSRQIHWI